MRTLLLSVLVLGAGLVLAETEFTKSTDALVKAWAEADSAEKRKAAMTESFSMLKRHLETDNPEDIGALARLFGAIYAWDYDPLSDTLSLLGPRLAEPEFARAFEAEVARLPAEQRDKLREGLESVRASQTCRKKNKKRYVCTERP